MTSEFFNYESEAKEIWSGEFTCYLSLDEARRALKELEQAIKDAEENR